MNELFTLGKNDLVKGLITALFASIFTVFYTLSQAPDFDVFNIDWSHLISNLVNVCTITFLSYVSKNFFTNSNDEFWTQEQSTLDRMKPTHEIS